MRGVSRRDTGKRRSHVRTRAETEVKQPRVRKQLKPPEVGGELEGPCLQPREEHGPAGASILDSRPPDCERINSCHFRPPSLW